LLPTLLEMSTSEELLLTDRQTQFPTRTEKSLRLITSKLRLWLDALQTTNSLSFLPFNQSMEESPVLVRVLEMSKLLSGPTLDSAWDQDAMLQRWLPTSSSKRINSRLSTEPTNGEETFPSLSENSWYSSLPSTSQLAFSCYFLP